MMSTMMRSTPRHIALQFGHIKHFNEGLAEVSRQLALQFAQRAAELKATRGWQFHFIMPQQWHGLFGHDVQYHELSEGMRFGHRFPVDLDVWHGLHQHMRYRPPSNCRHSLITVHDLNHVYAKKGLSLWWQNIRLTRHLRRCDQLVAISQYVADDLARHLPWAPPAQVIYNGVADLRAAPQRPVDALQDQPDFLLHISRMSPSKNVGTLIEMAAIWPEQLLVLVGPDSPEVGEHRQHVLQKGLSNVRFITDVDEAQKAWLYAHCQAFVFPSLMEGFGLPPIEAMYFGKPVIASSLTSLPEVCGAGAAYFRDFDAAHMREDVAQCVHKHQQSTEPAKLAVAQASQFNWLRAADQYLARYDAFDKAR